MAITRAQQVKQMLREGGRIGFANGPAGGATIGSGSIQSGSPSRDNVRERGMQKSLQEAQRRSDIRSLVETGLGSDVETGRGKDPETGLSRANLESIQSVGLGRSNLPGILGMAFDAALPIRRKGLEVNKNYFIGLKSRGRLDDPRYSATAQGYKNYMADRLAGKIDATGNPLNQEDDDDQIFIPQGIMTAQEPEFMDQETDTDTEDQDERFLAFRANGGRIGFFTGMRAQEQKEKAASNREDKGASQYKSTTAKAPPSMGFGNPPPNVRDDRGGSDNQLSPKSGKFPSAVKQSAKELAPFVIGGPFGILSRS